ncbi:MAG: DUF1573 domain-containing protein [Bacteroidaceae bacterium]|nr:DUF1573 domain-containing protein [Bacteroidaceae bacterium]
MKKKLILCVGVVLVFLFWGCSKQEKPKFDRHWKFIFLEKKKIFPDITGLKTLNATFKYYNDTGEPQAIDEVKTTCGCTTFSYPHKVIKAGERGEMKMTVKVDKDDGFVTQSASVCFRNQPPVLLRVIGRKK